MESVTVTCTGCGAERETTLRLAKAQARKNKHFDLSRKTTICRHCWLKRWHRTYKKTVGVAGYRDMQERRIRRARRSRAKDYHSLQEGRRGQRDSAETLILRSLRRYAKKIGEKHRVFLCAKCGKISIKWAGFNAAFGRGCFAEMMQSPEWRNYINRRRFVDPNCIPPWRVSQGRKTETMLRFDLALLLNHYINGRTVRELAAKHTLTEIAIKKALQRGRSDTWGHVFSQAKDPLRSARVANFIPSFPG